MSLHDEKIISRVQSPEGELELAVRGIDGRIRVSVKNRIGLYLDAESAALLSESLQPVAAQAAKIERAAAMHQTAREAEQAQFENSVQTILSQAPPK